MKQSVYKEKTKLFKESRALRDMAMQDGMTFDKMKQIRDKQNEVYKKYDFIKKLLKANEKINK